MSFLTCLPVSFHSNSGIPANSITTYPAFLNLCFTWYLDPASIHLQIQQYIFNNVHTLHQLQEFSLESSKMTHAITWPQSIQQLNMWNSSLHNYQPSLRKLSFDYYLGQDMNFEMFPSTLRKLTFNEEFNEPIYNNAF